MKNNLLFIVICLVVIGAFVFAAIQSQSEKTAQMPQGREEVIFWHFWGGADRDVVETIVNDFNESQEVYWVRAVAMPGNNLDTKIFLSITGGDPPDLVNQDDPIVADWAHRGLIDSFEQIAPSEDLEALKQDLLPSARRLGTFDQRLFAICNGLDIRALYYNKTILDEFDLEPPKTIDDLNLIAKTIAPIDEESQGMFGYLPDSRRLWAWGYVFGGDFYDQKSQQVTCDDPRIVESLEWMAQYSKWYGPDTIAAFRQGDQSLPGKPFPLLPLDHQDQAGRYAVLMDGQWRVRDILAYQRARAEARGSPVEFGVCPLPQAEDGRNSAGWVNGNFFVVPRGAKSKQGAWEFVKFWLGRNNPDLAAKYCAAGGWIPTTQSVSDSKTFKDFTNDNPLFGEFVELAKSENQFPVPVIPGAPLFKRSVEQAASQMMSDPNQSAETLLKKVDQAVQTHLDRAKRSKHHPAGTSKGTQP